MVPIIDQPRPEQSNFFDQLPVPRKLTDVPGLLAERVGSLYAAEERRNRTERTERLIRRAEQLQ